MRQDLPSVRFWQVSNIARLLNRKASWSITPLKIFESIDGNAGRSSSELKETRLLLSIPPLDRLPEELDDLI